MRLGILEPVDGVSEKVHKRGRDVLTKTDQFGHLVRRYEIDECLVALEQFRGVADRVDHVECNRCAALAPRKRTKVQEKIEKPDASLGKENKQDRKVRHNLNRSRTRRQDRIHVHLQTGRPTGTAMDT